MPDVVPTKWPVFDNPLLTVRPHGLTEINQVYGDPTRGGLYLKKVDPTWKKNHIVDCHGDKAFLPVLAPAYFPVHKLAEPSFREAFRRAEIACPGYIQRPGTWGFNFRHMRHDPRMPLSRHSWGIACDVNPDQNKAKTFAAGKTPKPWGDVWDKVWPKGVPLALVEAFESCGFLWGGRWRGYCDPMHFELCGGDAVQL